MNPTQLICAYCRKELPKVGGVEIRYHREDGKNSYYLCSEECGIELLKLNNGERSK